MITLAHVKDQNRDKLVVYYLHKTLREITVNHQIKLFSIIFIPF